jgi:hypothetical protein
MDRRKNWVFMTPEEMMGTDIEVDPGKDADGQKLTVMERYYQRLYDADHKGVTNDIGKIDVPSWNRATNAFSVEGSSYSPFSIAPDSDIFQTTRASVFAPTFDTGSGAAMPTPEEVRQQAEQKAHMDSFKQLWDIDQPKALAPSAPLPVRAVSTPLFETPQGGQIFRPTGLPLTSGNGSSQHATTEPTVSSTRAAARPPRADFSPQQRPF